MSLRWVPTRRMQVADWMQQEGVGFREHGFAVLLYGYTATFVLAAVVVVVPEVLDPKAQLNLEV